MSDRGAFPMILFFVLACCLLAVVMVSTCDAQECDHYGWLASEPFNLQLLGIMDARIRGFGYMVVPCGSVVLPVGSRPLRFTWTPPVTGTEVDHYIVQLESHSDGVREVSFALISPADSVRVRCAGVDSLGRVGAWSEWSEVAE